MPSFSYRYINLWAILIIVMGYMTLFSHHFCQINKYTWNLNIVRSMYYRFLPMIVGLEGKNNLSLSFS